MFEENFVAPEWCQQCNKVAALDFWLFDDLSYSVHVLWSVSQFYFEGKKRQKRSRHIYFPRSSWQIIAIGDRGQCVKFLTEILPAQGCPSDIMSTLIDKVQGWEDLEANENCPRHGESSRRHAPFRIN